MAAPSSLHGAPTNKEWPIDRPAPQTAEEMALFVKGLREQHSAMCAQNMDTTDVMKQSQIAVLKRWVVRCPQSANILIVKLKATSMLD